MLGAAQPDALGAITPRLSGLFGLVRIGPDLEAPDLVGPAQDPLQIGLVLETGGDGRQRTDEHFAGRTVEADRVAFLERNAVRGCRPVGVVDLELVNAGHTWLADLPGHDRRVARGSTPRGQDALRDGHAVEVVR